MNEVHFYTVFLHTHRVITCLRLTIVGVNAVEGCVELRAITRFGVCNYTDEVGFGVWGLGFGAEMPFAPWCRSCFASVISYRCVPSLVVGRWSLVVGRWSLVVGRCWVVCWSLVVGRWSLLGCLLFVVGLFVGRWSLGVGRWSLGVVHYSLFIVRCWVGLLVAVESYQLVFRRGVLVAAW